MHKKVNITQTAPVCLFSPPPSFIHPRPRMSGLTCSAALGAPPSGAVCSEIGRKRKFMQIMCNFSYMDQVAHCFIWLMLNFQGRNRRIFFLYAYLCRFSSVELRSLQSFSLCNYCISGRVTHAFHACNVIYESSTFR